jgi:hypothetical protein
MRLIFFAHELSTATKVRKFVYTIPLTFAAHAHKIALIHSHPSFNTFCGSMHGEASKNSLVASIEELHLQAADVFRSQPTAN